MREGERKRVVSLVASGCDIIRALGCTRLLVGHAHTSCDAEALEAGLEVCTESRTGEMASSTECQVAKAAIEAFLLEAEYGRVGTAASLVEWALAPHRVSPLKLAELNPDIIITQLQSSEAVCVARVEAAVEALLRKRVRVVEMDVGSLEGVWKAIACVAQETGLSKRGQSLIEAIQGRVHVVRGMCRGRQRRRVLCLQWDPSPVFHALATAVGAWVSDLIQLAGGTDIVAERKLWNGFVSMDTISASSPEILILTNPQWGLKRMYREVVSDKRFEPLLRSSSCPLHVVVADGTRFFSRPGPPLLVDSLEALCEILHPESQPFGHLGSLWSGVSFTQE